MFPVSMFMADAAADELAVRDTTSRHLFSRRANFSPMTTSGELESNIPPNT